MSFENLNVKPEIVRALKELEFEEPTFIQKQAIPLIKTGRDVIGKSKTGSGKTAAFGVPLLEKMTPGGNVQALVIAPTRELAVQISKELKKFGKYTKISVATVYGGVSIHPQMKSISKSQVVVGTPGRLLDHLQRGTLNLSDIKVFVLDEADRLVDMGFIRDIKRILGHTPKGKQMLLFGATISGEIESLKRQYMNSPAVAEAEAHVEEDVLEQYYYDIGPHEKFSLLCHLLTKEDMKRGIIFCSTIATVNLVASNLRKQGIRSEMIHGKLAQNKRMKIMDGFKRGDPKILVASAVAARGLDIKDVTHIFNYDLSQNPEEYIHRIGRTARAGETGKAITLLSPKDHITFQQITRKYGINVTSLPGENFRKVPFDAKSHRRGSYRGNRRKGPRKRPSGPSTYGNTRDRIIGRSGGGNKANR